MPFAALPTWLWMMTDGNRRTTQPMGNLTQVHNNPAELISTLGISNGDSLTIRERAEPAAAAAPAAPPSHDALLSGFPSIAAAGNAEEDDDAQLAAAIAASLVDSASTQLQLEQQQQQQRLQQQQQKASVPSGPAPTPAGAPTALLPCTSLKALGSSCMQPIRRGS